jgi:hypothetical protein
VQLPGQCASASSRLGAPALLVHVGTRLNLALLSQRHLIRGLEGVLHSPIRQIWSYALATSGSPSQCPAVLHAVSVFFGACCTDTCITPVGNATGAVKPMTRTPLALALRRSMGGAQRAHAVWNTLIDRHQGTTCASVLLSCFVSVIRRATVLPYKENI